MAAARDQYHAYVQTEREGEVLQAVLDTGSHRKAAAALGVETDSRTPLASIGRPVL